MCPISCANWNAY